MIRSCLLFAALFAGLVSCSKPEPAVRISENPFEVMPAHFRQNVLLESFVAEWTTVSTQAALQAEGLKKEYPERVFVSSMHINDWLAIPYNEWLGDALGGLLDVPRGAVNRTPAPDDANAPVTLLTYARWAQLCHSIQQAEAPVALAMETGFADAGHLKASVYVARSEALPGTMRLLIYLTQDSLPALFQQGGTDVYVHRDVLRDVFPSAEGMLIDLSSEPEGGLISRYDFNDISFGNLPLTQLRLTAVLWQQGKDYRDSRILNVQQVRPGGNRYWTP